PLHFDLDILRTATLAPPESIELHFRWLCTRPFVTERRTGWAYHEIVRLYLLRHQRQADPIAYRALHSKLADYFRTRRSKLAPTNARNVPTALWHEITLDILHHEIMASPSKGWLRALDLLVPALRSHQSFAKQIGALLASAAIREELDAR